MTPETFAVWKRERLDKKAAEEEARRAKEATGRAMFEKGGWEGSDDEEEDETDSDDDGADKEDTEWDMETMRRETERSRDEKERERIEGGGGLGVGEGSGVTENGDEADDGLVADANGD